MNVGFDGSKFANHIKKDFLAKFLFVLSVESLEELFQEIILQKIFFQLPKTLVFDVKAL